MHFLSGASPVACVLLSLFLFLHLVQSRKHLKKPNIQEADFEDNLSNNGIQIPGHSVIETPWEKYANAHKAHNAVEEDDDGAYCHKMALRRCGSSFMKVFQLFVFLPEDQAYQAKCALRTAFYSCLKKFSLTPCLKPRRFHIEDRFRKRLADSLWSARACLLGVRPVHPERH